MDTASTKQSDNSRQAQDVTGLAEGGAGVVARDQSSERRPIAEAKRAPDVGIERDPDPNVVIEQDVAIKPKRAIGKEPGVKDSVEKPGLREQERGLDLHRGDAGKILIVEDDDDIRELIRANLELHGHETLAAAKGADALQIAADELPHLVLLDVMLPDINGFEVCEWLRRNVTTSHIPIIMITARGSATDKIAAFERGADDYIVKPFDTDELLARVEVQLRHVERNLLSELTGLPGNTQIEQAIKRIVGMKDVFWSILYVDIDRFKEYNDAYGFLQGNELIKATGRLIQDAVRKACEPDELDFVGHIGGDDFVVITQPDRAEETCRDIIRRFDATAPMYYSDEDRERGYIIASDRRGNIAKVPNVTVSIGVVTNRFREISNHWLVGKIAAEVKKKAKEMPGSAYYVDRRR